LEDLSRVNFGVMFFFSTLGIPCVQYFHFIFLFRVRATESKHQYSKRDSTVNMACHLSLERIQSRMVLIVFTITLVYGTLTAGLCNIRASRPTVVAIQLRVVRSGVAKGISTHLRSPLNLAL